MKKVHFLTAGLIFLGMLVSCNSDDSNGTVNNGSITEITDNAKNGTWIVTLYEDDGNNETNHFTGYMFTFGNNNVLTATNGANTYTGSWSITNSSSSDDDDNGSSDIDFNIGFATPATFEDLTDDWDIVEINDNIMKLVDVSGGNGGTDYLTFEKN
jgi:hypothetical protein